MQVIEGSRPIYLLFLRDTDPFRTYCMDRTVGEASFNCFGFGIIQQEFTEIDF